MKYDLSKNMSETQNIWNEMLPCDFLSVCVCVYTATYYAGLTWINSSSGNKSALLSAAGKKKKPE